MSWTEHRVAALKKLHAEGKSAGEIAKALGITRNSAMGKLYRMGLMGNIAAHPPAHRASKGKRKPWSPRSGTYGDWDSKLFEPWAERKERLAYEREAAKR